MLNKNVDFSLILLAKEWKGKKRKAKRRKNKIK
jgi:hypothetical protein